MAENPYAERLEYVRREIARVDTVRDFWRALGYDQAEPEDPEYVSYESARKYHRDRTPSIGYLVRVHEVYGVPMDWLILGLGAPAEGEARQERRETRDAVDRAIEEALPPVRHLPAVREAIRQAGLAHAGTIEEDPEFGRATAEVVIARELGRILQRFSRDPGDLYVFQIERFAVGVADGIAALAPRVMVHQRYRDVERAGVQVS